jgi:hypothetical protein
MLDLPPDLIQDLIPDLSLYLIPDLVFICDFREFHEGFLV